MALFLPQAILIQLCVLQVPCAMFNHHAASQTSSVLRRADVLQGILIYLFVCLFVCGLLKSFLSWSLPTSGDKLQDQEQAGYTNNVICNFCHIWLNCKVSNTSGFCLEKLIFMDKLSLFSSACTCNEKVRKWGFQQKSLSLAFSSGIIWFPSVGGVEVSRTDLHRFLEVMTRCIQACLTWTQNFSVVLTYFPDLLNVVNSEHLF